MDLLSFVILFIICVVIIFFSLFMLQADADLTLLYYDKCGRTPQFAGQVVWITGASSGIGEYLAYDFASRQAKLVLSGVSVEKLEKVKRNCLEMTTLNENNILLLPFSIEKFSVHEECAQKVIDTFGQIDILVNNAGVSQRADFVDIDIEVDRRLFDINVFGTVNLTRKVLKHMQSKGTGHIVVTSSMAGKIGAPYSSSYTGSKHALHGYFDGLRTEMNQQNIHVTVTCPGPVFSDLRNRCVTSKPNELYDEQQSPNDKKMATDRCSHLITVAIANKLNECWICQQPLLLLYYFAQYTPAFYNGVLLKLLFDKKRVEAMRSGQKRS